MPILYIGVGYEDDFLIVAKDADLQVVGTQLVNNF